VFLTTIFSLAAFLVLFPCLVLLGECLGAILPKQSTIRGERPKSIAVLIPAHNEAEVIGSTLEGIIPQLTPTDSLVVVADNCSDATAQIARTKGARVLERFDSEKKAKAMLSTTGCDRSLTNLRR
jgi:cellulose synthase/poly-beta-1,6-N-acetylglucosamine synthase-like glycosyltransferase